MRWSLDEPVTGERLQGLAEVSLLTPSIAAFHTSLRRSPTHEPLLVPGTHADIMPNEQTFAQLRGRRSIFVYSHLLESFMQRVLPGLDHSFVLISHNSDNGVDNRFRAALEDPRIVHWFAQNALIQHPRLTPLPIGVANAQWAHGNIPALLSAAEHAPETKRDVVYVNFDVRTNPRVRLPLLQRLESLPVVWRAPVRSYAEYLADMSTCRWVVSPPGNGIDCHRTWEALYLGTTPLVQLEPGGADLHDALPVIQMADLGNIDRPVLEHAQQQLASKRVSLEPLRMSYWRKLITSMAATAGRTIPSNR